MASTFLFPFHGDRAVVLPLPMPPDPFCSSLQWPLPPLAWAPRAAPSVMPKTSHPAGTRSVSPRLAQALQDAAAHQASLLSSLLFQHWLQQSLTLMELCPPKDKGLSYFRCFVNLEAAKTAELYLVNIDCYCSAPSFIHGKKNTLLLFILI